MARSSKTASQQHPPQKVDDPPQGEAATIPLANQAVAPVTKLTYSDLYRTIYCNNVRIGVSQWDLSVGLGQIIENQEGGSVIQEEIMVKFSPQFFKVLVSSLTGALQNWEATFGEISLGLGQKYQPQNLASAFQTLKETFQQYNNDPTVERD